MSNITLHKDNYHYGKYFYKYENFYGLLFNASTKKDFLEALEQFKIDLPGCNDENVSNQTQEFINSYE
jgi:hypothetical protein